MVNRNNIAYYLLTQGTVSLVYYGTMVITPFKPHELPFTWVDREISFQGIFNYFYISFFFLLLTAIVFTRIDYARKCMMVILTNTAVAAFFFFFFPTSMRPGYYAAVGYGDQYPTWLIHHLDRNLNCFPSLHIANAFAATFYFSLFKKAWVKRLVWCWFLLIGWSVLSTKQHYFLDVLGGMLLSLGSIYIHGLPVSKHCIKTRRSYAALLQTGQWRKSIFKKQI